MSNHGPVRIQRATPGDALIVRELVHAAYAKWVPVLGREPMPMKADYDKAIRDHILDLLYAGEQLVALIEMIVRSDHLYIENVAVMPGHQGKGLGHYLLAHAEDLARKAGLSELRLLTSAAFTVNIKLYHAIGYRIDREEPFMGGTTVYMSKTIAPGAPDQAG